MIALTLDIDWAPDFVIDWVAKKLIKSSVKATWFVTHACPAVDRLRKRPDLFELGIHPNFLPGSTHGSTTEEVLDYCMRLVPEARSMRTHGLVQSTQLLELVMTRTPIISDVSLFLPNAAGIRPVEYHWAGRKLIRLPYFWEDDFEMGRPNPCFEIGTILSKGAGLKIINFHPMHVYLNSNSMELYESVKEIKEDLFDLKEKDISSHINSGNGVQTMFSDTVKYLSIENTSMCLRDIN